MDELLTTAQAADALGVHQSYVRRLVADGRLPKAGAISHIILVRRADVERHARERRPRGRQPGWRAVTQLSSSSQQISR